jgi:pimeloyl-ACP methyl ester carboxylesterase
MKNAVVLVLGISLTTGLWAQGLVDKTVDVYSQKIHYLEGGTGPTVILLHGLGADATNWGSTGPALASKYHVVIPDQIGFGKSDKPMINYRIATLVDFLNGFCKKTGIAKAAIVGNSLGGWTAMAFTLAHPEKVEKMVLVDSAGYSFEKTGTRASRETLMGLNPSTIEGAKTLMSAVFANKQMANDAVAEQVFTEHLRKNDGYTINAFIDSIVRGEDVVDGKLGAIKVPTLVLWGREDGLTALAGGKMLAQEIAGSEMVIFDRCGHVPQIECSGPFNAALLKFLAGESVQQTKD